MNFLKSIKVLAILLSILLLNSCALVGMGHHKMTSQKVTRDGRQMLFGKISLEQLFYDYPEWKKEFENYQPQQKLIEQLKSLHPANTKVIIFLGTWCPDSKREVPRFFKIIKQAGLESKLQIEMWALDRQKKSGNDLPQKFQIQYVPTFVFLKEGQESGRIVETPQSLYLEEDVLQILKGK